MSISNLHSLESAKNFVLKSTSFFYSITWNNHMEIDTFPKQQVSIFLVYLNDIRYCTMYVTILKFCFNSCLKSQLMGWNDKTSEITQIVLWGEIFRCCTSTAVIKWNLFVAHRSSNDSIVLDICQQGQGWISSSGWLLQWSNQQSDIQL